MSVSRLHQAAIAFLFLAFAGMASGRMLQHATKSPETPATTTPVMPGSDRDSHGCIGSAGYQWCESTQQCYRSWEEDCPTVEPIGDNSDQMPGSDRDSHGCIGSAGYQWCESTQQCYRSWEEDCPATVESTGDNSQQMPGSDRDSHGCIGSAGYQWCESTQQCHRSWEEDCPTVEPTGDNYSHQMLGSDRDSHGCIGSAGYQWCESTQQCYRSWENDCPTELLNNTSHGTDSSTIPTETPASGYCPGAPDARGGWSRQEDPAHDVVIQEAAQMVVDALLGQKVNQDFEVRKACTQVVAGVNYFLEIDMYDKGNATAVVYQPLNANAPLQITSLHFVT